METDELIKQLRGAGKRSGKSEFEIAKDRRLLLSPEAMYLARKAKCAWCGSVVNQFTGITDEFEDRYCNKQCFEADK